MDSPTNATSSLRFALAEPADADAIAALRTAAADDLSRRFGRGHWSSAASAAGVLRGVVAGQVTVAWLGAAIVGTLLLTRKKPWAIDVSYFSACEQPLYLLNMAVLPELQRRGVGRACLVEASRLACAAGAGAIRLDAYDAEAGAGEFYRRCGFVEVGRVVYRNTPLVYFEQVLGECGSTAPPPCRPERRGPRGSR